MNPIEQASNRIQQHADATACASCHDFLTQVATELRALLPKPARAKRPTNTVPPEPRPTLRTCADVNPSFLI